MPALGLGTSACSFAQQRLWFLDQYAPGTGTYNIHVAWRIAGELDVELLSRALNEIVRRHAALRTTFEASGDAPMQVVAEILHVEVGCRAADACADEEALRIRLAAHAHAPFDLQRGPLIRAEILKLQPSEHALLLVLHHAIADAWSMGIMARELCALYGAWSSGQEPALKPLPIQYADFAAWQREWLQGEVLEVQRNFWRRTLAGAPPALELPTDRPRPHVRRERGAIVSIELAHELWAAVRLLGRQQRVTPFMLVAAAFSVLLQRYSGQDDICIGYPVANRRRPELEGLIGFFVNTLVLRTELDPDQSFESLLWQIRESVLDADAHQDLPFEKLVEDLSPRRDPGRTPLFQVMLLVEGDDASTLQLPGLALSPLKLAATGAKFDLTLDLRERDGRLVGGFEYDSDLFDAARIERMALHLRTLLESAARNPQSRLQELRMVGPAERERLLAAARSPDEPAPTLGVTAQFEWQVHRTPQAVALVYGETQLSYAELNERANRLAHYLRAEGVVPDALVGLCVERGPEMVVGMLGILKAGGAYVPLDPGYPARRLSDMWSEIGAGLLLTQASLRQRLPMHAARTLCLDADWQEVERHSANDPEPVAEGGHLAYCIYTSGSTGAPKGALNTRRGLANLLRWYTGEEWGANGADRVVLASSVSFDLTQKNILGPLVGGGLLIIPDGDGGDVETIALAACRHEATRLNCAPSAYRAIRDSDHGGSLRTVILGGEPVDAPLMTRLSEDGVVLVNSYGPTECSDVVLSYRNEAGKFADPVPLGRPVPGVRLYVLDRRLEPVAFGVTGEIHVGGIAVGRGYLHQPALTASKFVPDPFGDPGCRMYRTGDLGRLREDGQFEFLGRLDHQVKIRGFRVELGEVEAALLADANVHEAVVLACQDDSGDRKLVAYIVARESSAPTPASLRGHLRDLLPEHMVPGVWVFLPGLPLSPNGKVDRKALPVPKPDAAPNMHGDAAPRNVTEDLLAAIWCDVLRRSSVPLHADFFELGGHSLLATRMVSRARQAFGVDLRLREVFEAPTIARLAERIRRADGNLLPEPIVPISTDEAVPTSHAQQRLWLLDQLLPGTGLYNIPMAWRLAGELDEAALQASLDEIVRRHHVLRTSFRTEADLPLQVVGPVLAVPLHRADLAMLEPGPREDCLQKALHCQLLEPFNLARGTPIRASLLRLGPQDHVLLLTLHHIAADGWSMGVLGRELEALYGAFVCGQDAGLAPLPIQYADYAAWQRRRLQGDLLQRQIEHWKGVLKGAPALLELPTDRPRPPVSSHRGGTVTFELGSELGVQMRRACREHHVTLFMLISAAFSVVLGRHSRQKEVCLGYPVANRNRAELEGLVGFLVNTLVLRTRLEDSDSFADLLARVRDAVLDADAHQELPFERLVEELNPERSPDRTPLFQAMVTLNNTGTERLRLTGLGVTALQPAATHAKFDLTLHVVEHEENIACVLEYAVDLFDHATIERMAGHLRTLLGAAQSDVRMRLASLPLLSPDERAGLLAYACETREPAADTRCIHELFQERVRATPAAVAVMHGQEQLSYEQLNDRANRLAHFLRAAGVRPDTLVALSVERGVSMVVGLMGILKAGGAYVPIDPEHPLERISVLIEDTAVSVLLTQAALAARLPTARVRVVCMDEQWPEILRSPGHDPVTTIRPHHLAYCIHTSGSTGRPKGVAISHRGLVASTLARHEVYGDTGRFLLLSSLSFDSSVAGIFGALTSSQALVVAGQNDIHDPAHLCRTIARSEVRTLLCVPALYNQILDEPGVTRLASGLRTVIVAGEACSGALVAKSLRTMPSVQVFNEYGPTEGTVWATVHRCGTGETATVPIGKAIPGCRIQVLEDGGDLAPVGVAGEICITGTGLARGYLHRPALTAERFTPARFGRPGERMYRTGDLGKRASDGTIHFLGRIDDQVKLRGYRIELGEVEDALLRCEGVREAAASVRMDAQGEGRLVAYLVMEAAKELAAPAMARELARRLPRHLVPSQFVQLSLLARNHNGKVDRKALPAPVPMAKRPPGTALPLSPLQERVRAIWLLELGISDVGLDDNFFEVGGTSLSIVRVRRALEQALHRPIAVVDLFSHSTIASLCIWLEAWTTRDVPPAPGPPAPDQRSHALSRMRLARASKES